MLGNGTLDGALVQGPTRVPARKEPVGGPVHAPVGAKCVEEHRRQHRLPLHIALAVPDADDAPGAIDIGHTQMERLGDPEPSAVERHGDGPVGERRDPGRPGTGSEAQRFSSTGTLCVIGPHPGEVAAAMNP